MRFRLLIFLSTLFSTLLFNAQSTDEEYIARFAKIAVQEMQIYKIPASITLAQGLLETADGQSELAQNANNHFGIKCKQEWTGQTYRYTDDAYMECFRKYNNPEESYRDHSKFLAERPYYKALFSLDIYDYKAWAHGLKKAGYATNPRYAPLLISKIEKYNLQQFDRLSPDEVDLKIAQLYPNIRTNTVVIAQSTPITTDHSTTAPQPYHSGDSSQNTEMPNPSAAIERETILEAPESRVHPYERIQRHDNKNLKYIHVLPGETLTKISREYDIDTKDLKKYNDISNVNLIKVDEIIYLQKKKTKGRSKIYVVQEGDTLRSISQEEGIQLDALLKRNGLNKNSEITEGQLLYLKGKKK